MKLDNLELFELIVQKGSLAAAGRELGLSATTVSERLAVLENHYGVTLLNRTTRSIGLTEEGRTLLTGARRVLAEVAELDSRVRLGAKTLTGLIRVSAPIDLGRSMVSPVIDSFLQDHPDTSIDLILADDYVDIVSDSIDIAVRFGTLADSTMRARKLGINRRIVCASPEYLAKHGQPNVPKDLVDHNCLVMRFGMRLDGVWHFRVDGLTKGFAVSGNRIANDGALIREWCLAGSGIMLKSIWDTHKHLRNGSLVQLLGDYAPPPTSIQLVYPPGRNQPRRVTVFSERLAQAFNSDITDSLVPIQKQGRSEGRAGA